jgi:hypothetical protein
LSGYLCVSNDGGSTYKCMKACRSISDCTNNNQCFHFDGEDYGVCNE